MKAILTGLTVWVFGLAVDASCPAPQAATAFGKAVDNVLWATGHVSRPPQKNWWQFKENKPLPF
jgi:hypothetical protein